MMGLKVVGRGLSSMDFKGAVECATGIIADFQVNLLNPDRGVIKEFDSLFDAVFINKLRKIHQIISINNPGEFINRQGNFLCK